jgi:hypothetical protein
MNTENEQPTHLDLPDDAEALKELFIQLGGNPSTQTFQRAEMRAVDKAHIEVNTAITRQQQAMHPWALAARNLVLRGMEVIAVVFTVVLVLFGMLIGSGLLVIAEVAAVYKGFQLIEPSGVLALLYACTTVLFFLTVLFIREIVARKSENEPQPVFSLRLLVTRVVYFLGVRRVWAVEYRQRKPLLVQVDNAITALSYTMILFGLLGRLQERMSGLTGNWLDGLRQLVTLSSLQEMVGMVGAVMMTLALLSSTHFILYFVHLLYVRVTGGGVDVAVNFSEGLSLEAAVEREKINLYKTEILRLRAKNRTP